MTEAGLIAWMRALTGLSWTGEVADRIEALIFEVSTVRKACSDLSQQHIAEWNRAETAEAKLAKAVELLTLCRDMFGEVASPSDPLSVMLNETLAEIKGESHE